MRFINAVTVYTHHRISIAIKTLAISNNHMELSFITFQCCIDICFLITFLYVTIDIKIFVCLCIVTDELTFEHTIKPTPIVNTISLRLVFRFQTSKGVRKNKRKKLMCVNIQECIKCEWTKAFRCHDYPSSW